MNPGRFYIPGGMGLGPGMVGNMARTVPLARMASSAPIAGMASSVPKSMGLFSKITSGIRSVNWGGLLNNANKTLNVVNQTIPLVRQAGPMFNNNFNGNTNNRENISNKTSIGNNSNINNSNNIIDMSENIDLQKKEVVSDSAPNFFV